MKAFMNGIVDRMSFRNPTASGQTTRPPVLGRVAIVTFDDADNQNIVLNFAEEASELRASIKARIAALPGTAFTSPSKGSYKTTIKNQIERVLDWVVDRVRANHVNGEDLEGHAWDSPGQAFDKIETNIVLISDKSFLEKQNIKSPKQVKELDLTCSALKSKGAGENARIRAQFAARMDEVEKYSRPFYEWVELNGGQRVNGLCPDATGSNWTTPLSVGQPLDPKSTTKCAGRGLTGRQPSFTRTGARCCATPASLCRPSAKRN